MKKTLLIFGLILLSGSAVFAHCCDCCYSHGHCHHPPRHPHVMRGYSSLPPGYSPVRSAISVNIGSGLGKHMGGRGGHYGRHGSSFGASIRLSI